MLKIREYTNEFLSVNSYIIYCDETMEAAVIDPGLIPDEMLDGLDLKYILLTHAHIDHMQGAKKLMARGAKLLVHSADVPMLQDARLNLSFFFGEDETLAADRTLADGDIITLGNVEIKVIHTPGHTPGSVCYLYGDDLFSGDTLFLESVGRTDFPYGDEDAILRSVAEKLYTLHDCTVYTGHGENTSIAHEMKNNQFIRAEAKGEGA